MIVRYLDRYINGDLSAGVPLREQPHEALRQAARSAELELVVRRPAVAEVVRRYINGSYAEREVQIWASFVRWGSFEIPDSRPIFSLNIEFDPEWEEAIVGVVARLDELGDVIDRTISVEEAKELLHSLGAE